MPPRKKRKVESTEEKHSKKTKQGKMLLVPNRFLQHQYNFSMVRLIVTTNGALKVSTIAEFCIRL